MWDYWFMSTTCCKIITTRCRLHGTSTTAFHKHTMHYKLSHSFNVYFVWLFLSVVVYKLWINFLVLSVSLIHIRTFSPPNTRQIHPHCHHHHSHHQFLVFFTLDLKHISSSSLFHRRLHNRYSLDWSHGLLAGPFFFCSSVLVFSSRLSAAD